jgi:hypothetical protein
MKSKKNILITLGDSWVEGVGCWSDLDKTHISYQTYLKLKPKYINRFHKFGWPNHVGKLLGYDEVINLGKSGSSTSGQVKRFMEFNAPIGNIDIIWMITEPSRISFYSNHQVRDHVVNSYGDTLIQEYIKYVKDLNIDTSLEQIFYINIMREICSNRNYNLLITYYNEVCKTTQNLDTNQSNYLFKIPNTIHPPDIKSMSKVCGHPNELGYEYIANLLVDEIKKNHSHFVKGEPTTNIEWSWQGDTKLEIKKNIFI